MTLIIGLVGEKGGGKGAFIEQLKRVQNKQRIRGLRFSDILRETLELWHIPFTRANLQKIKVVMDEGFGADVLSNAVYERISKLGSDIIVVDGVRWETDAALIRKFPKNLLVYITASPQIRFKRTVSRAEKTSEQETSFEQFMKEEEAANELLIPKIGADADYAIKNEGTIEEYEAAVAECYRTRIAPLF